MFIAKKKQEKYLGLFASNAFYDSFRQGCVDKWHWHNKQQESFNCEQFRAKGELGFFFQAV